jgi:16S rRNA (uracil1498-N3)-methyltransferase
MNLLLVDSSELQGGNAVTLRDRRADHLRDVLHVTVGQQVRAGIVDGPMGTAVVEAVADDGITVRLEIRGPPTPRPCVDLLLALPRPKVMRRLWAQLSALGIDRILLVRAARVERNYFDTHVLQPAVYRPLLLEGLQQAMDTALPRVSVHRQLKPLVEDHLGALFPSGARLIADPSATRPVRKPILDARAERAVLAIGPEGGWTRYELDLFARHGFLAVSTGHRTLRSDTACIVLLGLLHDALAHGLSARQPV